MDLGCNPISGAIPWPPAPAFFFLLGAMVCSRWVWWKIWYDVFSANTKVWQKLTEPIDMGPVAGGSTVDAWNKFRWPEKYEVKKWTMDKNGIPSILRNKYFVGFLNHAVLNMAPGDGGRGGHSRCEVQLVWFRLLRCDLEGNLYGFMIWNNTPFPLASCLLQCF